MRVKVLWPAAAVAQLLAACVLVAAAPVVAAEADPTEEAAEAADAGEALYAAPTRLDRIGRVLAAVEVNGQGPFRFILDTGSNRSAISVSLAATLGLVPAPGATMEVHGVTGFASVPAVTVARLGIGEVTLLDRLIPVLPDAVFANADGILGVEGLQGAKVDVDFLSDSVTIRRATGRRAGPGYLIVPARLAQGGLLLVDGRVGRIRTRIILDTGAERTIGNLALQRALEDANRRGELTDATITGATPGTVGAVAFTTPTIAIGNARLRRLSVTFADVHVFSVWELLGEPALVVGMDVLGTLERFVVDYRRREFQFRPIGADGVSVQSCRSGACGTRLPKTR